jgi:hypothetical protein
MTRRQYDDEGDDILKDGEHLHVPVYLLDGFQRDVVQHYARQVRIVDAIGRPCGHRPGHAFVSTSSGELRDAAIDTRDIAYAELEKRSAVAWRTNVFVAQTNAASDSSFEVAKLSPADARDSAFAELEKRSANAWRGGR